MTGLQGKGEGISLTPHYHFHLLHKHLDISRAITAERVHRSRLTKLCPDQIGPSLAASLEPLARCRNIASLSLFCRYYFGRCSSELVQLVPLPYSRWMSTRYSDKFYDFSVTIPRFYKDAYVNSFSPRTARL